MHQEDIQLLDRLRRRDPAAFAQIVRTYEQVMLRTAYRIVGQQADAEEVRQTIWLKVWQSPDKLPQSTKFGTWIRRCVVNESIVILRRRQREQRRNTNSSETLAQVVEQTDWNDEAECLRKAMTKLEPEQRAMLSLRFDEQLTIREIANILEQPHTTVQSKLKRTIGQLRERLETSQKR